MITELEAGGVPVLLGPSAGPMRAGLVFRVGEVDETLARHGLTHLVEHLALHSTGAAGYHYNGVTGAEHTSFHIRGSAAEVTGFLTGVCAALRDLPMGRMAAEKEILRTEASTPGPARAAVVVAARRTPAFFGGTAPSVLWDAVVHGSARAEIFAGVLQRRLFRELRQEGGLSYLVQAEYESRADGTAVITAGADALPEKQAAVLGGFVDVLAGLRAGRIGPGGSGRTRSRRRSSWPAGPSPRPRTTATGCPVRPATCWPTAGSGPPTS